MSRAHVDGRLRGYIDRAGRTPPPLRERLEKDLLIREDEKVDRKIGPPPAGYEKPTDWKRVAESPEGTVLLATHEGWESIAHDLTIARREPKYAYGEQKMETVVHKTVVKGKVGRVLWRGNTLEGVKLSSLRVPGRGDKNEGGAA